jgi:hypothetical protein
MYPLLLSFFQTIVRESTRPIICLKGKDVFKPILKKRKAKTADLFGLYLFLCNQIP